MKATISLQIADTAFVFSEVYVSFFVKESALEEPLELSNGHSNDKNANILVLQSQVVILRHISHMHMQ